MYLQRSRSNPMSFGHNRDTTGMQCKTISAYQYAKQTGMYVISNIITKKSSVANCKATRASLCQRKFIPLHVHKRGKRRAHGGCAVMTLHFSDFPKSFGYSMSTKQDAERDILPGRCLCVCRPSSLVACLASVHFDAREAGRLGMKMFAKK